MIIDCFQLPDGTHLPLSNFSRSDLTIDGKGYPTVEHYYQASKARDDEWHEWVRHSSGPGQAKRRGNDIALRDDWDAVKLHIMRIALVHKFRLDTSDGQYLLNTKNHLLIEGNTWGDRFWGQVRGEGWNWLGILLMARRAELVHEQEENE